MSRLLIRIKPYHDESIEGFCYRLMLANGYSTPRSVLPLLEKININHYSSNIFQDFIADLSKKTEIDQELLFILTVKKYCETMKIQDYLTSELYKFLRHKQVKFCPLCLSEGFYHKLSWDFTLTAACTKHEVYLLEKCPECRKRISLTNFFKGFCKCGASLKSMIPKKVTNYEELEVQKYLSNLLNCSTEQQSIFEENNPALELPIQDFVRLFQVFNTILSRYPTATFNEGRISYGKNLCTEGILKLYTICRKLIYKWPDNFYKYLNEYRVTYKLIDGVKNTILNDFCYLFRYMSNQLPLSRFDFVWNSVSDFLHNDDEYLTGGLSKFLKNIGLQKKYISSADIVRETGMSVDTIKTLINFDNISCTKTVSYNQKTITRFQINEENYKKILNLRNGRFITRDQASKDLGTTIKTLNRLISLGHLKVHNRSILLDQYNQFKEVINKGLDNNNDESEYISLRQVIYKYNKLRIGTVAIINLIMANKIKFKVIKGSSGLFNRIYVERSQLEEYIKVDKEIDVSINRTLKILGVGYRTLRYWIANELLKPTRYNKTNSPRFNIDTIEEFQNVYILVSKVKKCYKILSGRIHQWIKKGLLKPVSGPKIDGSFCYLLLRSNLEEVLISKGLLYG